MLWKVDFTESRYCGYNIMIMNRNIYNDLNNAESINNFNNINDNNNDSVHNTIIET